MVPRSYWTERGGTLTKSKLKKWVSENPEKAFWLMRDIAISLESDIRVFVGDLSKDERSREYIDERMLRYVTDGKDEFR